MRTPRRRLARWLATAAAVVVAAAAVGGVAWARSGGTPGYRTAAVGRGAVTSSLDLVGTITPLQSTAVGFAQSGRVASVDVTVGQQVTAGQTLAQLDLTALRARLAQAQAAQAAGQQTLAEAEAGQLAAGGATGSGDPQGRSGTVVDSAGVQAAQQKVETAQKAADQAQAAAGSALTAATAACPSTTGAGRGGGGTSCLPAETALLQAEQALAGQQRDLASAQATLATQLTQAASGSGGPSTSSTSISAVELAQYQAAVDADTAAVAVAQQDLEQGTAVSPLSGTVVFVGMAPGDAVSAASATQVIAVSAPNGYEVQATVPTADIASVGVGERASVVPDGGSGALAARVTSVGAAAGSSGFPVILGLSGPATGLRAGASAAVTITTGAVTEATVVPTSAVHSFGSRHVVEVLSGGTVQPAAVTIGIVGPLRTQVLSGLAVGQRVVLADLSSTVTSDDSTTGLGAGRLAALTFARAGVRGEGAGAGQANARSGG